MFQHETQSNQPTLVYRFGSPHHLFSQIRCRARMRRFRKRPPRNFQPVDKAAVKRFEGRVKDYMKLRNAVKAKLPKLSKDATPEQIESYRENFEAAVRNTRTGAKPSDIFNHEGSDYIRRMLKANFVGQRSRGTSRHRFQWRNGAV